MAFLLDTDVAIHLRDGDPVVTQNVAALRGAILLSIFTRVELEGGVVRDRAHVPGRRVRLDAILSAIPLPWPSTIWQRRPTGASSLERVIRAGNCSTA